MNTSTFPDRIFPSPTPTSPMSPILRPAGRTDHCVDNVDDNHDDDCVDDDDENDDNDNGDDDDPQGRVQQSVRVQLPIFQLQRRPEGMFSLGRSWKLF